HPVTGDHAVRGALVLDLEHDALVRLVGDGQRLGDHTVEPGSLELVEPALREAQIRRGGGDVKRRTRTFQGIHQCGAAVGERPPAEVVIADGQQVEGDERRRRLLGQHPHPRIGRVDALLQCLEVEAVIGGDDDLAVDHAALRQLGDRRGDQLGEIAGHRFFVAAADLDLIAVAEKDRPEAVPLRLIRRVRRDRFHRFGQHRRNRRHHRQVHNRSMATPAEEIDVDGIAVRLTNPDKVYFPKLGSDGTKRKLVDYYRAVAAGPMLASLKDRPTHLQRFPDGIDGEEIYQKRIPQHHPDYLQTCQITFPSGRTADALRVTHPAAIVWAAQMGTITLHPWQVRCPDTEHPDELRVDLDPQPGTGFDEARSVAVDVLRPLLDELGLVGYPKTSGGRGVHVFL